MRAAAIITYDAHGAVLGWNAGAAQLSGHTESALLGQPLSGVLELGGAESHEQRDDGESTGVLLTASGERLIVSRTRATIRDGRGAVLAYTEVLSEADDGARAASLRSRAEEPHTPTLGAPSEPDAQGARVDRPVTNHATSAARTQRESPISDWLHSGAEEAQRRLQLLADTLPQLVWSSNAEGSGESLSERWREYVGVASEKLLGAGWLDHIHPEDRAHVGTLWQQCVEEQCEFRTEYRIRRHDGVYRWIETRASALRDEEGRVVEWFGCNTDIHDARALQETLERERELLKSWIATAPGVAYVYRVEPDGTRCMPRIGPGIEAIYGLSAEQLARDASAMWARILPEDVPQLVELQERAMRLHEPFRCEFRVRHPTRGLVWVESSSSPGRQLPDAHEWVGFLRDITERKQAEVALRTMQVQLVAALEAGGMGLWRWDVACDALHMDSLLLQLLGRGRDELSGTSRDAYAFVAPEDVEAVRTAMHALSTDGTRRDFEHRVVWPDGQVRWLSVRAKSERDESGAVDRVTALHIDVTQQKHATEARLHSQKLEALGTLAGGIAHDFNNILQAISGNTALALLTLPRSASEHGFLNEVAVAAARASELVRQILAFSRPGGQPPSAISLAEVIGEALKLVRATLPATIAIQADLDDKAPHVAADASKIHQVVVNLATNAAHAVSATRGTIEVSLQAITLARGAAALAPELAPGSYIALRVRDNGSGIAPSALPRIFDPFYTTKAVGQGTGLGLSVVHGIVKSLSGAVTVESELGTGTTFTVYLPAAETATLETKHAAREVFFRSRAGEDPAASTLGSRAGEHPAASTLGSRAGEDPAASTVPLAGGERVLFVDDERMLVTLGVGMLKMLGMRPTGFSDPRAALAAFEAAPQQFDAVITDASMPRLSGYELAARLLALRPDLPIIMLSGYLSPEELAQAAQLGVREVLMKPVSVDELNRAFARATRGQPHGP